MSAISLSSSTTTSANTDLPAASSADELMDRLTKFRARFAQNVAKGQLSAADIEKIAKQVKAFDAALKTDGVNGTLTRPELADLSNQLNQQSRQLTQLSQSGKAQSTKGITQAPDAKNAAELSTRIQSLRQSLTNGLKNGQISGSTAKGLTSGLANIVNIFNKYQAQGTWTATQLSDLSGLVNQAHTVITQQTNPTGASNPAAAATSGLSLVNFLA
jgi:hypothetical protein